MKEIRPTEKALLAIADFCPIIATSWIDKIEEDKDSTSFLLPAIDEHQPPYGIICETLPQRPNFLPMPKRRYILSNMTFYVFSEQQFNRMRSLVSKCQGEITYCKLGSYPWDNQDSIQQVIAKDAKSLLIFPPSETDEDYNAYQRKWEDLFTASQKLGERLIAEVEVGWAIVFGSTEAYCNKHASDPIESSTAFSVAARDTFDGQSQARSSAAENPSTFSSEVSSAVVRPQEPIPPSWVLGNVAADEEVAVTDENPPAVTADNRAAERATEPVVGASDRARSRTSKRNLHDFFDAMFDDLDDSPVGTTSRTGADNGAERSNLVAAEVNHSAPAESSYAARRAVINRALHVDDASSILDPIEDHEAEMAMDIELDQAANEIQQRYGSEKLQEINDRAYVSSDEEVNEVTRHVNQRRNGSSGRTNDQALMAVEVQDEASISAAIEKQKKSLKASMKRSQDQAVEQDNSFVTNPSERYTTIVVKSLIKSLNPLQQAENTPQADVVNFKRFRKTHHQQPNNDMSYIRMLPHDEIHSAMQGQLLQFLNSAFPQIGVNDAFIPEAYWLQREPPQVYRGRPGSQGGEKLAFD